MLHYPMRRRALELIAVIALGAVALRFVSGRRAPGVGHSLGEVRAELSDGSVFRLAEHRNQVVVINFWASWCQPCREEIPTFNALHARGVHIIGLSVEELPIESVRRQANALGIEYPVGKGAPGLTERLDVRVLPTTYVVNGDGVVVLARSGAVSDAELAGAALRGKRP